MRNFVKIVMRALAGEPAKAGALSCEENGVIYSYGEVIAERTGPKSWLVQAAGLRSVTTSKHCNGVARELVKQGFAVTRS